MVRVPRWEVEDAVKFTKGERVRLLHDDVQVIGTVDKVDVLDSRYPYRVVHDGDAYRDWYSEGHLTSLPAVNGSAQDILERVAKNLERKADLTEGDQSTLYAVAAAIREEIKSI